MIPVALKPRVLVVDDAVVMRRLVSEVLERDGGFEVVGTAPNGRLALQKLTQLQPDVVTLDVEMPEMDGLQTLRELRKTHPRLPVIMFSLLTQRGAAATLDALAAGASDYVTKPGDSGSLQESFERLKQELVPKLRAHCRLAPLEEPASLPRPPRAPVALAAPTARHPIELVCVSTSTGGPNALAALFAGFREPLRVPVAIVQHMPPTFTQMLAARLDSGPQALRCREAAEGEVLRAGCAYLAPGGKHLAIDRNAAGDFIARLNEGPLENSCRPAADVMLRTAAQAARGRLLSVVMTGMGQDGMRGSEQVRAAGGQVIAQDEASSVVWGMPGAVAQAGLAEGLFPLSALAAEIQRRVASNKR